MPMQVMCPNCSEQTVYDWSLSDKGEVKRKFAVNRIQFTITCQKCDIPFDVLVEIFEKENKETIRKRIIEYVG